MKLPLPSIGEVTLLLVQLDNYRQMVDRLKVEVVKAQQLAERLRRSLLVDAFMGRLVAQDPGDEPASVLLEHIRAERAVQSQSKRTRRTKRSDATQETLL